MKLSTKFLVPGATLCMAAQILSFTVDRPASKFILSLYLFMWFLGGTFWLIGRSIMIASQHPKKKDKL